MNVVRIVEKAEERFRLRTPVKPSCIALKCRRSCELAYCQAIQDKYVKLGRVNYWSSLAETRYRLSKKRSI